MDEGQRMSRIVGLICLVDAFGMMFWTINKGIVWISKMLLGVILYTCLEKFQQWSVSPSLGCWINLRVSLGMHLHALFHAFSVFQILFCFFLHPLEPKNLSQKMLFFKTMCDSSFASFLYMIEVGLWWKFSWASTYPYILLVLFNSCGIPVCFSPGLVNDWQFQNTWIVLHTHLLCLKTYLQGTVY